MRFRLQCCQKLNFGHRLFREFVLAIQRLRESLSIPSIRGCTESFVFGSQGVRESMILLKRSTFAFSRDLINSKVARSRPGWKSSHAGCVMTPCVVSGCAPSGLLQILETRSQMNRSLQLKKIAMPQRLCPVCSVKFQAHRLGCYGKSSLRRDRLAKFRMRWAGPPWGGDSGCLELVRH